MPELKANILLNEVPRLYAEYKENIDARIAKVLTEGRFINGPEVKEFAIALATYQKVSHAIPCANGTDALQIALMALELSLGDEVITTAYSFAAAVEVCCLLQLKPVLVDIDPRTYNMDVDLLEQAITPKTKCIIPVHLFGLACDMTRICQIADKHDLKIIEDNAQSFGTYYEGQLLGTFGDISITSFFPTKNLGCFGDGGAIFTNNENYAHRVKSIVNHGTAKKYHHVRMGVNSRLDTIQATIMLELLSHLDHNLTLRKAVAKRYLDGLAGLEGLVLPLKSNECTYNQFTLRVPQRRDELKEFLSACGISTAIYYPEPLHTQPAFQAFMDHKELKHSQKASTEVLSLPMHPLLKIEEQQLIIDKIKVFLGSK